MTKKDDGSTIVKLWELIFGDEKPEIKEKKERRQQKVIKHKEIQK